MAWGGLLLSPCPFWIRFCQLNFYQKIPNPDIIGLIWNLACMAHIHSYLSTYLFPRQILQAGMHSKYLHMYVGVFMDMHRLKLQSYHGYKQRLVLNFTTFYKAHCQFSDFSFTFYFLSLLLSKMANRFMTLEKTRQMTKV